MMNRENEISIIKNNGERVLFDREKLVSALRNADADPDQIKRIVANVEQKIYNGIPSKKIYQMAYGLLKKESHRSAGRYRLKRAIFELGPTGFPFENFVGKLFESFGYEVKTGQHIQGKCVQHEVDVVAIKPDEQIIIECKFHSDFKGKTNVQVPLYIDSRFRDIEAKWIQEKRYENLNVRGFVATNSRFTQDAVQYAECAGLGLISWDYPAQSSLKYYIDKSGLHPLTSLHALKKHEQKSLLEKGIVLSRELLVRKDLLKEIGIADNRILKIQAEAKSLISKKQ
jgi:hypothetical protein